MASNEIDMTKLVEVCRANDASMVGVFGSFARGEATDESDVDVLIRFRHPKSLVAIVRLERELTAIMGRKVDLLTEASLSPYLRPVITRDLHVIYEAA